MGDWGIYPEVPAGGVAPVGSISVTCGASNSKGSYAEVVSSLGWDVGAILVQGEGSGELKDFLYDIAIGAAGSEKIIINNLIHSCMNYSYKDQLPFLFPIKIPAGQRVACRGQLNYSSTRILSLVMVFMRHSHYQPSFGVCETYGAATGDSGGTSIDCGGSTWTYGSWSEIVSSTTRNHRGFIIGAGGQQNSGRTKTVFFVQLGMGAAGSEQVIYDCWNVSTGGSLRSIEHHFSNLIPISVPSGTRLAVRAMCGTADAADRCFDAIVYAFS